MDKCYKDAIENGIITENELVKFGILSSVGKPTRSLLEDQGIKTKEPWHPGVSKDHPVEQYCDGIRRHLLDRDHPDFVDEVTMFRMMSVR